jgi:acyl-CoA synthetase (AMP-forming)/AMP-acid ligase II
MEGLFGFLQKSSQRYPDRTFVKKQDQRWTYQEIYAMAERVSVSLLKLGVKRGEPVLLYCDNSVEYVAAFFGILGAGSVAVPVNPARMTESLLYILDKCAPGLILAGGPAAGRLSRLGSGMKTKIVEVDRVIRPEHAGPDRNFPGARGDLTDLCRDFPGWDGNSPGTGEGLIREVSQDENDPAVILFTSGTTAMPKGVTLTHGNLAANTAAIVEYLHLTCEDSVLMTLPFTYSYGNSVLLTHACAGAAIVLADSAAYPYKVLEGLRERRVSGFSTVGSYINLMLKCIKNSETEENFFESLRYITFAGESTNTDDLLFIAGKYPTISQYVMYGQTEASARLSYLEPELLRSKIGSIGKGLSNAELKVVNENGCEVRPGEIGEILARGPGIMKGYWKDPEATEEVLENGWLRTGDYATVDEDGFIYIKGRKTDMIKYMGHRISPVEIENVINSCSWVKESAVIESRLESASVIQAFIVPEGDYRPDDIRKFINARLPLHMRPQRLEAVGQLPRTDSGKIKRSVLRGNR